MNPQELLEEEWLTVKAVARKLNVHPNTVYEIIRSGALKAVRIGRTIRIPSKYLEEYIQVLFSKLES